MPAGICSHGRYCTLAGGHGSPWTVVSGFGEGAGQLHQAGASIF